MTNIKPGHKQGRKPIDLVASTGYRSPQDAVWEAIRALRVFTLSELVVKLMNSMSMGGLNQETVKSYVKRLEKGEYLAVVSIENLRGNAKRYTWRLVNDVGVNSPRLTKDGKPSTQGLARENLWRSMKILSTFDYRDLCRVSKTDQISVSSAEAKDYIKHLYRAGYLQLVTPANQKTASPAQYKLLPSHNTGPKPPMIQRLKRVFDANLNKVMHTEEPKDIQI